MSLRGKFASATFARRCEVRASKPSAERQAQKRLPTPYPLPRNARLENQAPICNQASNPQKRLPTPYPLLIRFAPEMDEVIAVKGGL